MSKKIFNKLIPLLTTTSLVLLAPISRAAWNDVTFSQDTNFTMYISGTAYTFTVLSGSNVENISTDNASFTIQMGNGSSITIQSTDKKEFSTSTATGITKTCTSSYSQVAITSTTNKTETVTPLGNTCTVPSSGSSSSDSGSTGGTTTPSTPTTPTMPETTTGEVTATSSAGGKTTLTTSESTTASVKFPANSVTASTTAKITTEAKSTVTSSRPTPSGKNIVGGYAYNFTATANSQAVTTFSDYITLTFTYTAAQISGLKESALKVYYWDSSKSQWTALSTTVDTSTKTVTAQTNHFTYFALMGESETTTPTVALTDGDTIRLTGGIDVYIVKIVGTKKFKRLVLNPQVFTSYGHLKWENVKSVDQATLNAYTTADLVREIKDTKVYKLVPNGDVGAKHWVKTMEAFNANNYDWSSVYIINATDRDNYTTGKSIIGANEQKES